MVKRILQLVILLLMELKVPMMRNLQLEMVLKLGLLLKLLRILLLMLMMSLDLKGEPVSNLMFEEVLFLIFSGIWRKCFHRNDHPASVCGSFLTILDAVT